ncbi:MAG TPA: hypothetical protein VLK33_14005, partial [Terriglobales bacterium]|nr:hypothetical protein [Terriglobales bacterium]
GPSNTDRRNVAFVNFVYDLPFLRNSTSRAMKATLGGWQVSGIVTMQSGTPINVSYGQNSITSIIPNAANRPNLVGPVKYTKVQTAQGFQWFDPSSFGAPDSGTWGDLGHNALRGPGRDNWNLSLFKTFAFTERVRFELRAESFNTWNHLQYKGGDVNQGGISNNTANGNFGIITGAFDPRTLQLGGKLIF